MTDNDDSQSGWFSKIWEEKNFGFGAKVLFLFFLSSRYHNVAMHLLFLFAFEFLPQGKKLGRPLFFPPSLPKTDA